MNHRLPVLICTLSFCSLMPRGGVAEVLDRIVARVNGHIILESDWEDEQRFEAFMNRRRLADVSAADEDAALHHLVDQELLEEQMRSADFKRASDEEVNERIAEVRKQYPEAQDEPGWNRLLAGYRITPEELQRRLALELDVDRLVEARLRPSVTIDQDAIASYYNHELLPRLRSSGAKEVSLDEASAGIKEVLTEQRLNELLVAWLENLRSGSEIHTATGSLDSRNGSP
jgi:peptidyl-prolyl cis-trans isomerase SurA